MAAVERDGLAPDRVAMLVLTRPDGDHRRVRQFAASAEQHAQDSDRRDEDLASLVVALAEVGDDERARRVAMSIADPRTRAVALADLALASHEEAARRLLAEIVNGESWRSALPAVAALDLAAVRGLADALLQRADDAFDG
jgi:hypothetical protein